MNLNSYKGQPKVPGSGRKKGTPNKATKFGQEIIANLLGEYQDSGKMSADFEALEPKDRLLIAERLANYILPKRSAVDGNMSITDKANTLSETLSRLASEND